jgi:hypothetical protein
MTRTHSRPGPGLEDECDVAVAVAQWIETARREIEESGFAQIDLDDLLSAPPPQAVKAALACMNIAVDDARGNERTVEGLVVVPLEPSPKMAEGISRLADLVSQAWTYGPGRSVPGIYLLDPAAWSAYEPVEEYRLDLGTEGLPTHHVAYYRAWRSLPDTDEFDRAVYIRHVAE